MEDVVKELGGMLSDHVCCVFPQASLLTTMLVAFFFFPSTYELIQIIYFNIAPWEKKTL